MKAWYVPSAGEQPRLGELPVPEVGDHAIPPAELLAMARQARAHITMAPGTAHQSMIHDPGLVARVILRAVRAPPR